MALTRTYSPEFERIWRAYPSWPKGRSKKEPSSRTFEKMSKDLSFTTADIDALVLAIDERKKSEVNWQRGSKFGPPMLSTWLNQMRWQDQYADVKAQKRDKFDRANEQTPDIELTPEQRVLADRARDEAMRTLRLH